MDGRRMFFVLLAILATNTITAFASGMICYNAGWKEAFDFTTANHVRVIEDMKKS